MERKAKRVRKVVGLMTDPKPEFVSMVSHAANQTPFLVVRADQAPEIQEPLAELAQRSGADAVGLQSIVFEKKSFPNQETVSEYLDNRGYSAYSIVDNGNTFSVAAGDTADFEDIQPVNAQKGVTMNIGRVRQLATKALASEAVAKGAATVVGSEADKVSPGTHSASEKKSFDIKGTSSSEIVQKYSIWMGEYSEDTTLAGIIEEGMYDGLPPGWAEISYAFEQAMSNVLKAGDTAGVTSLCNEMADITIALAELFKGKTALVEKMMTAQVAKTNNVLTGTGTAPVDTTPVATPGTNPAAPAAVAPTTQEAAPAAATVTTTGTTVAKMVESPANPVGDQATTTAPQEGGGANGIAADPANPTGDQAKAPGMTMDMNAETITSLSISIATAIAQNLGQAVGKAMEPLTAAVTDMNARLQKSDERIDAVEASVVARKGTGDLSQTAGSPEAIDQTKVAKATERREKQMRNTLGL